MSSFGFDGVDTFVVGTVGMPGDRTFYLQAQAQRRIVSFKCEKGHIVALCGAIGQMLERLGPHSGPPAAWRNLDLPILPEWEVGVVGLGYDTDAETVVLVLHELQRRSSDSATGEREGDEARFSLTRAQAAALVAHGTELISAGRPVCVVCGTPIDPDGVNCACMN